MRLGRHLSTNEQNYIWQTGSSRDACYSCELEILIRFLWDTHGVSSMPQPCTCSRRSDFLPFHEFALTRPSARSRKKSQVPPEWLYAALEMVLDWITKPGASTPRKHAKAQKGAYSPGLSQPRSSQVRLEFVRCLFQLRSTLPGRRI